MARHVLIAAVVLTVSVLAPRTLAQDSPVVPGNTAFGLALFKRFAERPGNVVCSPFSISTALAMTAAGARGNTLAQMSTLLGLDLAADDTHRQFGALLADLDSRTTTGAWANDPDAGKKPFELVVANALWGQQDYPFSRSFMAIVSQQYRAGIQAVDFRGASDATRRQINAWVEERTSSRIKDILGPVDLGPDARLVLTNAIYFKAAWAASFHASDTCDQPFHLANGDTPAVPTMHCAHHLRAFDAGAVDIVELPYMARAASMLLIIPKATGGLAAIEAQLEPATLTGWLAKLRHLESEDIALALPRFKLTSRFELSPQLQAMGMIDAFKSPAADFTAMSPTGELFIGRVIHEAYVDVDEAGTEAAAATHVTGDMEKGDPRVIKADRPFLWAICDTKTGSILFLGRVADPRGQAAGIPERDTHGFVPPASPQQGLLPLVAVALGVLIALGLYRGAMWAHRRRPGATG